MKAPETHHYRPYLIAWLGLLLLLVSEIVLSRLAGWGSLAPLFGVAMAGIVAFVFMDLRRSNNLTRIFAIAGVFWLVILLGLGILDPVTRVQVSVPQQTQDWRLPVVGPGGGS